MRIIKNWQKLAYELKNLKYYDASINRFYYSIYQKMNLYILIKDKEIYKGKDAHKENINIFLNIFYF